jgi:hypothetical protein
LRGRRADILITISFDEARSRFLTKRPKLMSLFDRIGAASLVLPLHHSQYFLHRIVHSQMVTIITLPWTPRFPASDDSQVQGAGRSACLVEEGRVHELLLNSPAIRV